MAPLRLVVVGGGITGLAAAYRAVELARERAIELDLTLLEARARLGGTIATERAGGFLVEAGPPFFPFPEARGADVFRRLRGVDPVPPPPGTVSAEWLCGALRPR